MEKNKLIPIGTDVRVAIVEIITDAVTRNLSAGTIDAATGTCNSDSLY